jgi:hypothetical protein
MLSIFLNRPWIERERVALEVADTPDPAMIGKLNCGEMRQIYAGHPGRPEAAFIHLDSAIDGHTIDVLVFRRNSPSLIRRSEFVYVVPWTGPQPDDVNAVDVLKRAIFIAEIKHLA